MMSLEDYHLDCEEQDVQLYIEDIRFDTNELSGRQGGILGQLSLAGRMLRIDPNRRLASWPITPTPEMRSDVAATALTNLVNDSIHPYTADDMPTIRAYSHKPVDNCPYAECSFSDTLRLLGSDAQPNERGALLFVNDDGDPLVLKKRYEVFSAIALQPLVIHGKRIPAGSIMGVDTQRQIRVPYSRFEVLNYRAITAASFKRLSGLGLHPDERQNFVGLWRFESSHRAAREFYQGATADSILALARQAVARLSGSPAMVE